MKLELDLELDHMPQGDPTSPVSIKITDEGVWISLRGGADAPNGQEIWIEVGDEGNLKAHCYRHHNEEAFTVRIYDDHFETEAAA